MALPHGEVPQGPPYFPQRAILGGIPSPLIDTPISAVIIALFLASATLNMSIFIRNKRRAHKFILSGLFFGFSLTRVTANALRIAWASFPASPRIVIAAQVFINAGVILLLAANVILAQRVLRAYHPQIGWHRLVTLVFRFLLFSIGACFIMLLTTLIDSFFTIDLRVLHRLRNVQLFSSVCFAFIAAFPSFVVAFCLAFPRTGEIEKFGTGSMRVKLRLLLGTSLLLTFGAAVRSAAVFIVRPIDHPAPIQSRAALYCADFVVELIVVFSYALSRFDLRFHVPNGSSGPGDYSSGLLGEVKGEDKDEEKGDEKGLEEQTTDAERSTDFSLNSAALHRVDSK